MKNLKIWFDPDQSMALSVNYFKVEPDIPSLKDLDALRDFYRQGLAKQNGGIIRVDLIKINGVNSILTIFKIDQERQGMTYLSSITIPFKDRSYVVKIEAPEVGTTGIRATVIADKLMEKGEITARENGYDNWSIDPYDPNFKEGLPMNKSENVKYDSQFPDHPLSKSRILIDRIAKGIKFEGKLENILPFDK